MTTGGVTKAEFQEQLRQSHVDVLRRLHDTRQTSPAEIEKLKLTCYQLKMWRQEIDNDPNW